MLSPAQAHLQRLSARASQPGRIAPPPPPPATAPAVSPARAHLMRMGAKEATVEAPPGKVMASSDSRAHALMRMKLDTDRRRLKDVQSVERKIAVKREILPEYDDYIAGVLAAGNGVQDEVVGYVLCWRIDIGDYVRAIEIGRYVLGHNLSMPDRFERTPATLIAEEPAEQALRAYTAGNGFNVDTLLQIQALTRDHDMPDQVRAKLHFAIGRHLAATDAAQALTHMRRAVELNEKVGAKKDIEKLERQLRNEPPPSAAPVLPPAPGGTVGELKP